MSTSLAIKKDVTSPRELVPVVTSPHITEKCAVCTKPAFCYNYGVLSCNSCKMFFRRVEVDKPVYKCKNGNLCRLDFSPGAVHPQCKSCRFKRCLSAGMKYIQPGKLEFEMKNSKDLLPEVIKSLAALETRRQHRLMNFFTSEDPTFEEIIEKAEWSKMAVKDGERQNSIHEWAFMSIQAAIEFFMSFDIMEKLGNRDKTVLLHNFSLKAMLFGGGKRALDDGRDKVLTPDYKDVYPDTLYRLSKFSPYFLEKIRSSLTARLTELKVTHEEYVLLNAIFFLNPALLNLSHESRVIVSNHQKSYSNILVLYCQTRYQNDWPTRYTDLLSLCHVINRTFEDVHYLTMLVQFYMPNVKLKRLYTDLLKSLEHFLK